jgi:hypothetical protein
MVVSGDFLRKSSPASGEFMTRQAPKSGRPDAECVEPG